MAEAGEIKDVKTIAALLLAAPLLNLRYSVISAGQ
jgi:hypothetical protein